MEEETKFECWALLELMGRQTIAGKVTEETVAGSALLRVDVPGGDGGVQYTRYYHPQSLYCLTPMSEHMVRTWVSANKPQPIYPFQLAEGPPVSDDRPYDMDDDEEI